jgi:hypothetical protein
MNHYDFQEQLQWSDGYQHEGIEAILKTRVHGCCGVEKAEEADDRNGTDYWVARPDPLPPLSVDVKVRQEDWAEKGKDDLALETWSVVNDKDPERGKVGWTRNPNKRTDYVLWYWTDTRRFFLISFPALCRVFHANWQKWSKRYGTNRQTSGQWQSECVFVPRMVVIDAIARWAEGHVPTEEKSEPAQASLWQ